MGEWQPIETAPKDGTEVLGYAAAVNKCDVIVWNSTYNWFEPTQLDGEYGPAAGEFDIGAATHWMPLPCAPPTPSTPIAGTGSDGLSV